MAFCKGSTTWWWSVSVVEWTVRNPHGLLACCSSEFSPWAAYLHIELTKIYWSYLNAAHISTTVLKQCPSYGMLHLLIYCCIKINLKFTTRKHKLSVCPTICRPPMAFFVGNRDLFINAISCVAFCVGSRSVYQYNLMLLLIVVCRHVDCMIIVDICISSLHVNFKFYNNKCSCIIMLYM